MVWFILVLAGALETAMAVALKASAHSQRAVPGIRRREFWAPERGAAFAARGHRVRHLDGYRSRGNGAREHRVPRRAGNRLDNQESTS